MPSKGIDCYSYIGIQNCVIIFTAPKVEHQRTINDNFSPQHLEVDKKNINGVFTFDGRFQWSVVWAGKELASGYLMINVMSGNPTSGTMMNMTATQSIFVDNFVITYGFYDAGPGMVGLTSSHQCYVTVTDNYSSWMGSVVPVGSAEEDKPFSRFVLPAAHDVGMNNLDSFSSLINGPQADSVLKSIFGQINATMANIGLVNTIGDALSVRLAPDIVLGLAITQKDPVGALLQLGTRYFEFRPAFMENSIRQYSQFPDKLYFQHACIPGLLLEQFLEEIITFLDANPTEFAVIRFTWDGVTAGCAKQSYEDITDIINAAVSGKSFTAGNETQLSLPIKQLRSNNTRLLFFFNNIPKYDSYDDTSYATLHPDTITNKFQTMDANGQASGEYTVLQCQATATNIGDVLKYSIIASNASTSCLMETKARCTNETVRWARDNVVERLTAEKCVVLMNDFMDGATADVGVQLSRRRFAM